MEIRVMTGKDYASVYQLWLSCSGVGINSLDNSEKGIARFLKRNPETCLVALENNSLIGAILIGTDGYVERTFIIQLSIHIFVEKGWARPWLNRPCQQ